jgi:spermidine synthase
VARQDELEVFHFDEDSHADIVEISPAVLGADAMFAEHNYHVLSDPRTESYIDDAQSFLRTVPRRYDVILSQPANPWIAGVGGLFTVEYFENVRRRLNPGGLFAFWFQAYEQSDEAVQLTVRTVGSVFPHIMLFADNDLGNIIAVASMQPIEPDFAGMERRYAEPAIKDDLARLQISGVIPLNSTLNGKSGLAPSE